MGPSSLRPPTIIFPFPGALRTGYSSQSPPGGGQYGLEGAAPPLSGAGETVWIGTDELEVALQDQKVEVQGECCKLWKWLAS